ncbi:aspartyl protease family protein 2-like [Aristolochia californica]|uniref:aspartyl protease family protein 2-like n=1 Tax=Aristolochia californica TaxID=171875 RepID=UPI0035DEAAFA
MPSSKKVVFLLLLSCLLCNGFVVARSNDSHLHGIEFPDHPSFNSVISAFDSGCQNRRSDILESSEARENEEGNRAGPDRPSLKLHLKHNPTKPGYESSKRESVNASKHKDQVRIHTFHRKIIENKNQNTASRLVAPASASPKSKSPQKKDAQEEGTTTMMATLESGVSLGSGEYFMDVFIGTPPKHYSLILDTGSDLNWLQCVPCHDCFEQQGPHYNPKDSSSYRDISCQDPRCSLVSSPDPSWLCKSDNQTCQYFYWYGDKSNTTGELALETFTVNLTSPSGELQFRSVENVMFGCGHWNRGLFHGAAGLLGLGRGPLSFSSQLRALYGHTFSYCLVDRNSNISVSSKLIFGEDPVLMSHPNLNFTSLVTGKENPEDTFYYVDVKGIMVGGELLNIPGDVWKIKSEAAGGTIVDSGTTLSYFTEPAYKVIKEAFVKKVKGYPVVKEFPVLDPCYNVSGVEKVELPEFSILFADGAVWDFPAENYFIRLDPEEIVCLAILGTPRSSLSILGNYQQQNFHILYDTKKSRLGFAPMRCAEV